MPDAVQIEHEELSLPSFDDAVGVLFPSAGNAVIEEEAAPEAPEEALEAPETPAETEKPAQEATPAAEPQTAEVEQEQRLLQRIAEKEREFQTRMQAQKAELDRQQAELEQRLAKTKEWEEWERKLSEEDVLGALESRGWDLEGLAKAAIERRGAAPTRRLHQEVERQKSEIQQEIAKFREEQRQAQIAALQAKVEVEARNEIKTRSPLLNAVGDIGYNTVMQLAQMHHQSGQPVSYDTLVPEAERQLAQLLELALSEPSVREKYLGSSSPTTQAKPSPTLSSSKASQTSRRAAPPDFDSLSAEEVADQLFKGGLINSL